MCKLTCGLIVLLGLARAIGAAEPDAVQAAAIVAAPAGNAAPGNAAPGNAAPGGDRLVRLKLKVLELSHTDLRDLGVDLSGALSKPVDSSGALGLLQYLKRNQVATELAAISVVTASGHSTDLEIGAASGGDGSEVHAVPTLLDGGRVRVTLRYSQSSANEPEAAKAGGKPSQAEAAPPDWQVEAALGGTTIFAGPKRNSVRTFDDDGRSTSVIIETQLLYVVKCEPVPATADQAAAPPAAK